jgi:DNA-binding Lrp family transcriptional regulator
MKKIDAKDLEILYQLDLNSRQSISTIGKKMNLHKNVVRYRIKQLERYGIIKNYYTVIDPFKLGYFPIRFYLRFQYLSPEIEKKIIDLFVANRCSWYVASLEGDYNIVVNILVKNFYEFSQFWDKILKKYSGYINNQRFSIYFKLILFEYLYLSKINSFVKRREYIIDTNTNVVDIDDIDYKILALISQNARYELKEIAEKLNFSVGGIRFRIKKLENLNIIQGYRVNLNLYKIGYFDFKVDLFLQDYSKKSEIMNYIIKNPNLVLISDSAGISDLELEFHLKDIIILKEIINDIQQKFPDDIKNYSFFRVSRQHKWQSMLF